MKLIQTKTLTSAASSIEFTSIPQTHTDLLLVFSGRNSNSEVMSGTRIGVNGSESIDFRGLVGDGSSTTVTAGSDAYIGNIPGSTSTSNTFGNTKFYFPSYSAIINKVFLVDNLAENNATRSDTFMLVSHRASTAAITSLNVRAATGNLVAGSSASLYGITKGSGGATVS